MKLDFAVFEPNPGQKAIIRLLADFCRTHERSAFTMEELLHYPQIAGSAKNTRALKDWLREGRQLVVLGDLMFGRDGAAWRYEALFPGTATYYALRLMPQAMKTFGSRVVRSDNVEFIALVYSGRARLLGKPEATVKPRIREFVKERLSRCGLETLAADIGSISEIWDIFDDYEFQELMGREPLR